MPLTKVQGGLIESTNEPVILGVGSSTGTASQSLQVYGGAYVSNYVAIGITAVSNARHVLQGVGTTSALYNPNSTNSSNPLVYFRNNDATAGTDATIRLDANGGTTTAATTISAISESTGGNSALAFATRSGGGTIIEKVRITSTGAVGIGTNNPTSKLQVQGTIGLGAFDDTETNFPGGRTKLTSSASGFVINHNDNSSTIFQNQGTERVRITSTGAVGIGTTDPVSTANLQINPTSSSNVVVLTSIGGSFGIGTTVPNRKLTVVGDARFVQGSQGGINITHSTVGSLPLVTSMLTESAIDLALGTTNAENMRIVASTGNVGIATTTPASRLTVNGVIQVIGNNNVLLDNRFGETTNGATAAPYIGWGSNAISRITGYSDGSSQGFLAFIPGGYEGMRLRRNSGATGIVSDVSLGIGITNPVTSARLQIGPNNTGVFIVDSAGRVGLGTTAFGTNEKMLVLHGHAANYNPNVVVYHNLFGNTTPFNSGFVNSYSGLYLGGSYFSNSGGGIISGIRDGGQNNEGVITLSPTDATGTAVERFRVNHAGNVGIGTTNLSVISANVATVTLGSRSSTVSGGITYQTSPATSRAYHYFDSDRMIHQSTKRHAFLVNDSNLRMVINESGDTIIGTGATNSISDIVQVPLQVTTSNFNSPTDTTWGGIYSYNGAQFYSTYIAGGSDNDASSACTFVLPCSATPTPFAGTVVVSGNSTAGGTVRGSLYLVKGEVITTAGVAAVQNTAVTAVAGDTASTSCSISATSLSSGAFIAVKIAISSGASTNQNANGVSLTTYLNVRRATREAG